MNAVFGDSVVQHCLSALLCWSNTDLGLKFPICISYHRNLRLEKCCLVYALPAEHKKPSFSEKLGFWICTKRKTWLTLT